MKGNPMSDIDQLRQDVNEAAIRYARTYRIKGPIYTDEVHRELRELAHRLDQAENIDTWDVLENVLSDQNFYLLMGRTKDLVEAALKWREDYR